MSVTYEQGFLIAYNRDVGLGLESPCKIAKCRLWRGWGLGVFQNESHSFDSGIEKSG